MFASCYQLPVTSSDSLSVAFLIFIVMVTLTRCDLLLLARYSIVAAAAADVVDPQRSRKRSSRGRKEVTGQKRQEGCRNYYDANNEQPVVGVCVCVLHVTLSVFSLCVCVCVSVVSVSVIWTAAFVARLLLLAMAFFNCTTSKH